MKKETLFCDICGEEFSEGVEAGNFPLMYITGEYPSDSKGFYITVQVQEVCLCKNVEPDICIKCIDSFILKNGKLSFD